MSRTEPTRIELIEEYTKNELIAYDGIAGYAVEWDDLVKWINENRNLVATILDLGGQNDSNS